MDGLIDGLIGLIHCARENERVQEIKTVTTKKSLTFVVIVASIFYGINLPNLIRS